MRHLDLVFRPLSEAAALLPYKTRCGLLKSGFSTAAPGEELCPVCASVRGGRRTARQPLVDEGDKMGPHEGLTAEQALEQASLSAHRGILRQDDYQRLRRQLPAEEQYPWHMGMIARQIRVRTSAVNIVDREEPNSLGGGGSEGRGDAGSAGPVSLWNSTNTAPQAEDNADLGGTDVGLFNKPMRSEGEKEASPGGWNLEDLTVASVTRQADFDGFAISKDAMRALLGRGLGLEYSQQLRYQTYAGALRAAFRDPLAAEFAEHAKDERDHAAVLARRFSALGGRPDFQVDAPEPIDPDDPDALDRVLAELWKREQAGIEYYLELRDACGQHPFREQVSAILARELEHHDDLLRLGHLLTRTAKEAGGVVNGPPPELSQDGMWADSYTDENAFEGTDKMGSGCPACTGRFARVASPLCPACAPWQRRSAARVAAWQRRADAVQRRVQHGELPIAIEWEPGQTRMGIGDDGKPWEREMHAAYGYIPGTEGADGEPLDVYLGGSSNRDVHVVSQLKDGDFDEEKCMIGFSSPEAAEAMYRAHYPKNGEKHFGGMHTLSRDNFLEEYQIGRPHEKKADHGAGDADGCGGEAASPAPTRPKRTRKKKPSGGEAPAEAAPSGEPGEASPPPAAPEPPPAAESPFLPAEPATEAPATPDPAVPDDAPLAAPETPAPKKDPKPKPKGPKKPPAGLGLPNVDTSKATSPAEEAWKKDPGRGKQFYDQWMKLFGGPGFDPYRTTTAEVASRVAEIYDSGTTGPLGTETDPPGDERVVQHAELGGGSPDEDAPLGSGFLP